MKTMQLSLLMLLLTLTLCIPYISAQDYTQWGLPEEAKARLGKGSVGEIAYSPDGNHLAVGSSIGIWIYDAHSLVELNLLNGHTGGITSIAFSPDSLTLASSSSDETVRLWDVATGTLKTTLTGHTKVIRSITFSPDGSIVAGAGSDKTIHLWDTMSGEYKASFRGHTRSINSVAFSPDGHTLASGSWDNTVQLWDVATGKQKAVLTEHTFFGDHTSGISHVAFSSDGQTFVSAAYNEEGVRFWNAMTGEHIRWVDTGKISSLALSPDGRTLATGTRRHRLDLWDVADGKHKLAFTGHTGYVNAIAFSPDGRTLVSGGGWDLFLWDSMEGAQKGEITGHLMGVYSIAFTPDSRTLASTGINHTVLLWDIHNRQHTATLIGERIGDRIFNITFSPDGHILAGSSGWRIVLWGVPSGYLHTVLEGYTGNSVSGGGIRSVAFSPDGRFLASGSGHGDHKIQIWYGGRTHKVTLTGHTEGITSIAFSPDSRTLASGSQDHTVRLWDVVSETHKITLTGHTGWVNSVAFSPDGKTLASGSEDTTICLWDTVTGKHQLTLTGHTGSVESVAFSPDGKTLASGGGYQDHAVQLWDVTTGTSQAVFTGHTRTVWNVAFSPDGKTLASGSLDNTILLWKVTPAMANQILAEDVNRDGRVNLQDLNLVASQVGQIEADDVDVNADGIVNIVDLVLVAAALGAGDSAPSVRSKDIKTPTLADVQLWLAHAQHIGDITSTIQRGIAVLEDLLRVLSPKKTVLLPNYPNPFNPETWIPYQLATSADVTICIYSASGVLVRTLALGYQPAGIYQSRSRAMYWDGKNESGEQVASGVYFYTLSAGQFTMTRRMVIRK